MHVGVAVISKEKIDNEAKMNEYFEKYNLYDQLDYFTIGGGWANTFNKDISCGRWIENTKDSIIQITKENIDFIKERMKKCIYYIVDKGNLISTEIFISNPNYNENSKYPEGYKGHEGYLKRNKEVSEWSYEDQKTKFEDWENYRCINNIDFDNFLNEELEIGEFITVLDAHE